MTIGIGASIGAVIGRTDNQGDLPQARTQAQAAQAQVYGRDGSQTTVSTTVVTARGRETRQQDPLQTIFESMRPRAPWQPPLPLPSYHPNRPMGEIGVALKGFIKLV
jgi:hypothetical protein